MQFRNTEEVRLKLSTTRKACLEEEWNKLRGKVTKSVRV